MTQIVPNYGTRDSQDLYVGLLGEITVDTSNGEIRLHDGSTPGGKRIVNLDGLSNIFQKHSVELDGLLGFAPNAKGIVTRTAAAVYALRQFTSPNGTITVTNPRGFAGDFGFDLADTVPGDHIWEGQQQFNDVIAAPAGLIGDVQGDLFGDVTGNLTGDSTGAHVGNVDVRGHTLLLDNGQIAQSAVAGLADALAASGVPIGTITMWGGAIEDVPTRWNLCDGTNGTPDLTDRFVMGTAVTANVGNVGGSVDHTHVGTIVADGIHTHTGTVGDTALSLNQIPPHRHNNGVCDNDASNKLFAYGLVAATADGGSNSSESIANVGSSGISQGLTSLTGGTGGAAATHTHGNTIADSGEHAHDVTIDSTNVLPPYLKLAYIMKIS